MPKATWKDATSYSRDDKERTPNAWELTTSTGMRLCVHRLLRCEGWFITCYHPHLFERHGVGEVPLEEAKQLAVDKAIVRLEENLLELRHAMSEL